MSAGELAGLIAAIAAAMTAVGLLVAMGSAIRTMAAVRRAVEDVHHQAVPLLAEAHIVVRQARTDLDRVDDLIETANVISHTVDSASRLAYTAFSSPVFKGLALATGVGRAARWLRRRR